MRVVAGRYGGRRLKAPPGGATRPTVERVREALFNILGGSVAGARVLDCYAGSGALGIEALSRGAAHAVFVDKGRVAVEIIRQNLATVGVRQPDGAHVLQRALETSGPALRDLGPFDLVLVDPPFASVRDGSALTALGAVVRAGVLAPDALVILEVPSDQANPVVEGLWEESARPYGDTRLVFLRPGEIRQISDNIVRP